MKLAVATSIFCFAINAAFAAEHSASGTVQKIFAMDKQNPPDWSHILIAGFSSAGTCPINDGLVALALRDDDGGRRQLAVALSAKLSDRAVRVVIDDSVRNSGGLCFLRYLELN